MEATEAAAYPATVAEGVALKHIRTQIAGLQARAKELSEQAKAVLADASARIGSPVPLVYDPTVGPNGAFVAQS